MSLLGDLPSFKASRNNPLATGSTNSLSTALDSLLGDSSTEKNIDSNPSGGASGRSTRDRGQQRNPPNNRRKSDLNFYSNLSMDAIEEEKDGEQDIDDMEASVFGSLGRKLSSSSRKNSRSFVANSEQKTQPKQKPPALSEQDEDDEQERALMAELNKGLSSSAPARPKEKEKNPPKTPLGEPQRDSLEIDDLLGGLSDGEEDAQKTKPLQRPSTKHGQNDSSGGRESTKTRKRGDSLLFGSLDTQSGLPPHRGMQSHNQGVDILKLDSSPLHTTAEDTVKRSLKRKSSLEESFDDGDILADLGLGDDDTGKKKAAHSFKPSVSRKTSLDVLGTSTGLLETPEKQQDVEKATNKNDSSNGDPDGFQFGGYVPTSSTPNKRKSSLRSSISEDDLGEDLLSRPNSAPTKKAVRFLESVVTEDLSRPATSPINGNQPENLANEVKRGQVEQRRRTVGDFPFSDTSTRPPTGRGRRRESSPAVVANLFGESQSTSQKESQEAKHSGQSGKEDTGKDSLFPWQKGSSAVPSSAGKKGKVSEHPQPANLLSLQSNNTTSIEPRPETDPVMPPQVHNQQALMEMNKYQEELSNCKSEIESLRRQVAEKDEELLKIPELQKTMDCCQSELVDLKQLHSTVVAELQVEKEKSRTYQMKLDRLDVDVKLAQDAKTKAVEEREDMKTKLESTEASHQQKVTGLQGEIDSLSLKCRQAELERNQLQQLVDTLRQQHKAEVDTIESSYAGRLKTVEESYQKREIHWRDEREQEASHAALRLKQMEKEKFDAIADYRRKMESLELSKANESERTLEAHKTTIEDLKREHELDIQHLKNIHHQEVDALKSTHTHTRTLAELSHQVEFSTKEFSRLQEKLEQNYKRELVEREEALKLHEESLKVQENRLAKQQFENDQERGRLQGLIAKLETNLTDQNRQIDKERWQLQQESERLHAQRSAFEQEREATLKKTEQERDDLQRAKDNFLKEQKQILSQCHEERRQLSLERAQLHVAQKKAEAKKREEADKSIDTEAELQAAMSNMKEESAKLASDVAKVRADREKLLREKAKLQAEKERTELVGKDLERRSAEVHEMAQNAYRIKQEGETALASAQTTQRLAEEQLMAVKAHEMSIRESQKQLAAERLALVNERKELTRMRQLGVCHNCSRTSLSSSAYNKSYLGKEHHHQGGPVLFQSSLPNSVQSWSPPMSVEDLGSGVDSVAPSTHSDLKQLQLTMSLRQLSKAIQEDKQALEDEDKFLKQLAHERMKHSYH